MAFSIFLDPRAVEDIQESIDYYDERESGLGRQFEKNLDQYFTILKKNPFFQVRYDNVRCLPLNKFPHMIHYTIDEEKEIVIVRAVFHTALDPEKWKQRKETK